MPDMTYRDMTLAAFNRQPLPHVLFQPRFEPWIDWNRQFDSLPEACQGKSVQEIYDQVDCSMRYQHYYTGQPDPLGAKFSDEVKIDRQTEGDKRKVVYHTPHGDLTATDEFSVDRVWRRVDYPGKSSDDLPKLKWLLARQTYYLDVEAYQQGDDWLGPRGVGQFWIPKSPYLALAQVWMNFEPFIFAMADAPDEMQELMRIIDDSYDQLYDQLTSLRITPILNFGENIAEAHMSPAYLQEYILPWYHKRVGQLKSAGIFSHVHIDGYFKSLLPHLKDFPHDAFEAMTPLPQGDVTLEEIAEHTGDKILLDLIPAVLFLDHHPFEQLQACVEKIVSIFSGRLILGISDELPQAATAQGYRRLKWVADYARSCAVDEADEQRSESSGC